MGYEPAMRILILMCLIGSMAAVVMTSPGNHRPHPHVVDLAFPLKSDPF